MGLGRLAAGQNCTKLGFGTPYTNRHVWPSELLDQRTFIFFLAHPTAHCAIDTYAQHLTVDCESSREGFMNIYFLLLKMKICKEKNEKKRPFFSGKKIFSARYARRNFFWDSTPLTPLSSCHHLADPSSSMSSCHLLAYPPTPQSHLLS